jgi:hypothetical protein
VYFALPNKFFTNSIAGFQLQRPTEKTNVLLKRHSYLRIK